MNAFGDLGPGAQIKHYEVVRFLAQGGFGSIYEARDLSLQRAVVIKSLRPEVAANPQLRARFLHEGRIAARLDHPNVVHIFESIDGEDGTAYIVMERLVGIDLATHVSQSAFLTVESICDLLLPICSAVAFAHHQGVLHRDIKPGNIFLARTPDDEIVPKLLDFGISKVLDDAGPDLHTQTGSVLGSPRYMAPEQFVQRVKLDGRVDVYALGAVLYRCATRALPYQRPDDRDDIALFEVVARITSRSLLPPNIWRPDLPAGFCAVILGAMAYERGDRLPSARALGAALLPFASELSRARWTRVFAASADRSAPLPPVPSAERESTSAAMRAVSAPRSRRQDSLWTWLGLAAAMVLLAAVAGVVVRRRRPAVLAPSLTEAPHTPSPAIPPPTANPAVIPPTGPSTESPATITAAPTPSTVAAEAPPTEGVETPVPALDPMRPPRRSPSRWLRPRRRPPIVGRRCANGADCDL